MPTGPNGGENDCLSMPYHLHSFIKIPKSFIVILFLCRGLSIGALFRIKNFAGVGEWAVRAAEVVCFISFWGQ